MLTLVCAATHTEARACRRALARAAGFEVLPTGMGPERAGHALAARLERGPRPGEIVSTGFAGSRSARLAIGTWILVQELRSPAGFELALEPGAWEARLKRARLRYERATLQTIDQLAGAGFAASSEAVDMESASLAQVALRHGVPFHVFRLISDTPDLPIPQSVIDYSSRPVARGLLSLARSPLETARFVRRMLPLPGELARVWERIAEDQAEMPISASSSGLSTPPEIR